MIKRLLIANRGEIACRIIRTSHAMGIKTIAVYSEADAKAMHVRMADTARCFGPASAVQSYLVIDRIIEANLDQVAQYRAGKTKVLGFFVGQVMKETGGKANPQQVNELIRARLG